MDCIGRDETGKKEKTSHEQRGKQMKEAVEDSMKFIQRRKE